MAIKRLHWTEVLNAQTTWQTRKDLVQWFSDLIGRQANIPEGALEWFEESLGFMRRQVGAVHFGDPVDLLWLDTQLKTVTLGLLHHQGAQEGPEGRLPLFRARVKGLLDSDLLRSVKDTCLVQFAEFVAESADQDHVPSVHRCEGIYPQESRAPISAVARFSDEVEQKWRDEIPALKTEEHRDYLRCPNFYIQSTKGKFCSDACRFTVQAKAEAEAELVEQKPRRYRRKR